MSQTLPVVATGILLMAAVWWLAGRFVAARTLRLVARVGAVAALALVAVAALPPASGVSAQSDTPAASPDTVPVETATVRADQLRLTLSAIGRLETQAQVDLSFSGSSPVIELLVDAGQPVNAGDLLARLDTVDAESSLRNAQLGLAEAENTYANLVAAPRDVDVAVAQAGLNVAYASLGAASDTNDEIDIESARLQAELARNRLWQTQMTRDDNLDVAPQFRNNNGGAQAGEIRQDSNVAGAEYDVIIADTDYAGTVNETPNVGAVSSAHAQVVQAQANLDDLVDGPSEVERRAAEIDVQNARLDVQRAEEALNDLVLTAPFNGIVAAENLTVGELAPAGAAITLIDNSQYIIKVSIDETDVVNVQPGQRVELIVDALPDARLTGTVTKLESAPVVEGQLVTYQATVTLDVTTAPIRPGMSATARIIMTEVDDALLVPNRFIQVDSTTQQPTVIGRTLDGQYIRIPVQLGARNETSSQILSGLDAGDEIFLLPQTAQQAAPAFGPPMGGGMGQNMGGN